MMLNKMDNKRKEISKTTSLDLPKSTEMNKSLKMKRADKTSMKNFKMINS